MKNHNMWNCGQVLLSLQHLGEIRLNHSLSILDTTFFRVIWKKMITFFSNGFKTKDQNSSRIVLIVFDNLKSIHFSLNVFHSWLEMKNSSSNLHTIGYTMKEEFKFFMYSS